LLRQQKRSIPIKVQKLFDINAPDSIKEKDTTIDDKENIQINIAEEIAKHKDIQITGLTDEFSQENLAHSVNRNEPVIIVHTEYSATTQNNNSTTTQNNKPLNHDVEQPSVNKKVFSQDKQSIPNRQTSNIIMNTTPKHPSKVKFPNLATLNLIANSDWTRWRILLMSFYITINLPILKGASILIKPLTEVDQRRWDLNNEELGAALLGILPDSWTEVDLDFVQAVETFETSQHLKEIEKRL
jgi:hypothetical protein